MEKMTAPSNVSSVNIDGHEYVVEDGGVTPVTASHIADLRLHGFHMAGEKPPAIQDAKDGHIASLEEQLSEARRTIAALSAAPGAVSEAPPSASAGAEAMDVAEEVPAVPLGVFADMPVKDVTNWLVLRKAVLEDGISEADTRQRAANFLAANPE